ncbi:MAG: zinc ribbon domain-containing protein [Candidatus Jordarchaeum sp.]|uniref:zinc ribbon domain-containing protein n=1 Tax=Candidatus Jordarchaeum sp. TaxID=2823881 RepID=UPI00404B4EB5
MPGNKRHKYCYLCGTEMEISDNYCAKCGAEGPQLKFCIICGKQLAVNTKFCLRCGFEQPLPEELEEIEDLSNVKFIFVRNNAGLALYEQSLLTSKEFNVDLLAGFTTAISNFSVELGKKGVRGLIFEEKKGTTSRMLAEVGEQITVVAMMNYESRSVKKKLKLLLKRIEEDCAYILQNWKGNVTEIREKIIPIVEEVFKVSRLRELEEKEKNVEQEKTIIVDNETVVSEETSKEILTSNEHSSRYGIVNTKNTPQEELVDKKEEIRLK